MKIASIDIGTNAIKSKVFNTTPTSIDFIEGIRSPIRLGAEVFNSGKLSDQKLNELSKTLKKSYYSPFSHYSLTVKCSKEIVKIFILEPFTLKQLLMVKNTNQILKEIIQIFKLNNLKELLTQAL